MAVTQSCCIVWFKRDLRVHDHEPLLTAAQKGTVIPLYILEPELWAQPDMSHRQYRFLYDSLKELNTELHRLGQRLIVRIGDAVEVLDELIDEHQVSSVYAHQETWNGWTYQRDIAVEALLTSRGVPFQEFTQNGVIRRLKDRDGWAGRWAQHMHPPPLPAPAQLQSVEIKTKRFPKPEALGLADDACHELQKGGRSHALQTLHSFLQDRGEGYTKEMSSPNTAFTSCSRMSAYLAFGCVSMREVYHACKARTEEIKAMPRGTKGKWPSAMRSFLGRLRWHCHFMQKLEDEPRIEFENMHRAYDGLREPDFDTQKFEAWKTGHTGYPMIDACMRALIATGWLNFRMRSMLMSFASYHLWLHWRQPSLYLAQMFTDYEPGIHYSQTQMQSGTTGINTLRIYNPIKQGIDHDPEGIFVKRWIPELADMPTVAIHTPWEMPHLMNGYPMPIVDEKTARKEAASKLYSIRGSKEHRAEAQAVVKKHGSRRPNGRRASRRRDPNPNQPELPL